MEKFYQHLDDVRHIFDTELSQSETDVKYGEMYICLVRDAKLYRVPIVTFLFAMGIKRTFIYLLNPQMVT